MLTTSQPKESRKGQQKNAKITLWVVTAIITVIILNAPLSVRSGAYSLQAGDVAQQDILATKSISYTSNVLTDRARQQARNSVAPVYLPADSAIKKQQLEKLKNIFTYINNIRADSYASNEQKISDLSGITSLNLSKDTRQQLLELSDTRWQAIQQETRRVLEESFRNTIRTENLENVRRNVDSLTDVSFTQDQTNLIHELVTPLIVPNSILSEDLTQKAREEAAKGVDPVVKHFAIGQIIVQHGQIVQPEDVEALEKAGLAGQNNSLNNFLASLAIVLVLAVIVGLYLYRRRAQPLDSLRSLVLISIAFNVFLVLVRFAIPYRAILPFIFPTAAFGLTLATAFNLEIGMIFSIVFSILAGYNLPGSLEITIYYII